MDETNRIDILMNLSVSMVFSRDVTKVEDVSNVVGAYCRPCSCDVITCTENGNCCLSKLYSDVVSDNPDDYVADVHNDVSDTNDTFSWHRCMKQGRCTANA